VTSADPSKKLSALLQRIRPPQGEAPGDPALEGCGEGGDQALWQLVFSFLAWESTLSRATLAGKRIHAAVVDYNEMRVCLPDELASIIGDRYPRALERVSRLRSTLNDLYKREHAVTLAPVASMGKREARAYLESLEGMTPYVAARLVQLSLGGHAFPLDERLRQALLEAGAVPQDLPLVDAGGWLERQFRAGEATEPYLLLEQWMNDRPLPKVPGRKRVVERVEEAARTPAPGGARKAADKPKTSRPRKAAKQ
jgi:endonuclease-3